MSFYKMAITGKHHLSLQEKASVGKKASGLDCVGKIKVSRDLPATREKLFLSEKETKFPNRLLLFKNTPSLGRYLNSTSRFLRSELAQINSDNTNNIPDDPSLAVPLTLVTSLSETQRQDITKVGIKAAEITGLGLDEHLDSDDSERLQHAEEGKLEAAACEERDDDTISEEELIGAVGGAPFLVKPLKSILKAPSSQASVLAPPDILYFTPPGTKESCFDALICFFEIRGQKLSDTQLNRLNIQFMQLARHCPLNEVVKEILSRHSRELALSDVTEVRSSIELITGIDINKESFIKAQIELEREEQEEKEQTCLITEKEQYKENQFFARLLLTPYDDWIKTEEFVEFVKLLSFETSIDLDHFITKRRDFILARASEFDDRERILQTATALAAKYVFDRILFTYRGVLPSEYRESHTLDSLVEFLDKIPYTDNPPFASDYEMQNYHLGDLRSDYNAKLYFFIQKIERFHEMKSSHDLNKIVSLVMDSASLKLKRQKQNATNYRQTLNEHLPKEPAYRAPEKITFDEKVTYKEIFQEDDIMQETYIPLPLECEIKSVFFGLDREIKLYYDKTDLKDKRRQLLKIANYYDCLWKTSLLEKVRINEISTLETLEFELAKIITTVE